MPAQEIIPSDIASETTLAIIKDRTPTPGQKAMANSVPVTIAFDQQGIQVVGDVDVAGSVEITNDIGNPIPISASALPLPTGAASETTLAALLAALKAEDVPAVSGDLGLPLLAMRQLADTTSTSADGDYTLIKIDEEGRVKVATKPASFEPVVGTANTVNAAVTCDVRRASNVVFHVKNIGSVTLAAGTFIFEASIDSTDGTDGTWFGIQAIRSNANTIETQIALSGIVAGAGFANSWECSVNGYAWIRLRCSVAVTASASAQWTIQRGSYATEPIPAAQISGTQPVSGTVTANIGTGTLAALTSANLGIPGIITDVASAAITTTANTGTLTPTFGCSYVVTIPVTAFSGTNPTYDVRIEESDDNGTNWYTVYEFPRITTTGIYRSPKLMLTGTRIRYVQTLGGTSPSFTRAINRLQCSDSVSMVRQLIDRTINLTGAGSATPSLQVQNCRAASLVINIGSAGTAPILQLEGSDDGGLTWYTIGNTLTAVASSTVRMVAIDIHSQLIRARVSTVGATVTAGYVLLKGF